MKLKLLYLTLLFSSATNFTLFAQSAYTHYEFKQYDSGLFFNDLIRKYSLDISCENAYKNTYSRDCWVNVSIRDSEGEELLSYTQSEPSSPIGGVDYFYQNYNQDIVNILPEINCDRLASIYQSALPYIENASIVDPYKGQRGLEDEFEIEINTQDKNKHAFAFVDEIIVLSGHMFLFSALFEQKNKDIQCPGADIEKGKFIRSLRELKRSVSIMSGKFRQLELSSQVASNRTSLIEIHDRPDYVPPVADLDEVRRKHNLHDINRKIRLAELRELLDIYSVIPLNPSNRNPIKN